MKKAMLIIIAALIFVLPAYALSPGDDVYAGGRALGIEIVSKHPVVISVADASVAKDCGVAAGDAILQINEKVVEEPDDISDALDNAKPGDAIAIKVKRGSVEKTLTGTIGDGWNGTIGVSVRMDISGIGTLTLVEMDGSFVSLGHGICDPETGELAEVYEGTVHSAYIAGVIKGKKGDPGKLDGFFEMNGTNGVITANTLRGIYGIIDEYPLEESNIVSVAFKDEIELGPAIIRCCIDGEEVKDYQCRIIKLFNDGSNKDFTLKVTDKELLSATGGIVQGMSGSPVIQNGKLVGAVTHVLVNDPVKGYGISIEKMAELTDKK